MKPGEYELLEPVAGIAAAKFEEFCAPENMKDLTEAIRKVLAALPSRYGVELEFSLLALDSKRETSVRLFTGGVSFPMDGEPYASRGDAAIQRYVVKGEVCVVPDDYCPHCWGDWVFKLRKRTCPKCAYSLGKEIKFLRDSDQCPYCARGTVTVKNPKCPECEFVAEPNMVVWGNTKGDWPRSTCAALMPASKPVAILPT